MSRNREKHIEKMRNIYILRRVVFLAVAFLLIFLILFIIFFEKKPETVGVNSVITPDTSNDLITLKPVTTAPEIKEENKKIIIYHTHNDEAYYKGSNKYIETDTGRSLDENYNIIAVGQVLKNNLEKYNFDVIHDKSNNISEGFNYAYDTSLKNIKKYIGNADIFIDVHRDAYSQGSGKNYISDFSGKEYAYIKFIVANGTKYKNNPNFYKNNNFAEKISLELNKIIPDISRGIMKKEARLNQHVSDACLLIEIGNEKNDIEQVKNSAEILAVAIYNSFK